MKKRAQEAGSIDADDEDRDQCELRTETWEDCEEQMDGERYVYEGMAAGDGCCWTYDDYCSIPENKKDCDWWASFTMLKRGQFSQDMLDCFN